MSWQVTEVFFNFLVVSGLRPGRGPLKSVSLGHCPGCCVDLLNLPNLYLGHYNRQNLALSFRSGFVEFCIWILGGGGLGVSKASSDSSGVFSFGLSSWVSELSFISWGSSIRSGVGEHWARVAWFQKGELCKVGSFLPRQCEYAVMLYDNFIVLLEILRGIEISVSLWLLMNGRTLILCKIWVRFVWSFRNK